MGIVRIISLMGEGIKGVGIGSFFFTISSKYQRWHQTQITTNSETQNKNDDFVAAMTHLA